VREKEVKDAESWPCKIAVEEEGADDADVLASVSALRSFRIAVDCRRALLKRAF